MSQDRVISLHHASTLAAELTRLVRPSVADVIVAGSVRRKSIEVRDLDLVAFPLGGGAQLDMFGDVHTAEEKPIMRVFPAGDWVLETAGEKTVRVRHRRIGLKAEVYLVEDRRAWGPTVIVRTGPRAFSVMMMTKARAQGKVFADGFLLHAHPARSKERACPDGKDCRLILDLAEEADVFTALGMTWIPPEERR